MAMASQYSTPIPQIWELDGYEFISVCSIMVEDVAKANGEVGAPQMSADSVQAFGKILEQWNGR